MSIRSLSDSGATSGLARAFGKIRSKPSSKSILVERARAADRAARLQLEEDEPCVVQRDIVSQSVVRSDGVEAWPLPGLAPMTRVRTTFGDVHAAALRKGDEVLTRSGRYLPIIWLNRILLDEHVLNAKPDSNPVVLAAGALGPGAPAAEIMVSPRQIVCPDDHSGLSKAREAAMLVSRPGVRRLRETSMSYTMFHLGVPAEVYCEGLFLSFPLEA